jgi:ABC-type multidrug transport system ATPase subunit
MDFVIETSNLSKRFGDVMALDGLNLVVPRHSIFYSWGQTAPGRRRR